MRTLVAYSLFIVWIVAAGCSSTGQAVTTEDTTGLEDAQDTAQADGRVPDPDGALDVLEELVGDAVAPDSLEDGVLPDTTVLPAGCCLTQADCSGEQVCVNTTGAAAGACMPKVNASSNCWADSDCGLNGPCISKGPAFEAMAVDCDQIPQEMGLCKGAYTYCCFAQSDCPEPDSGVTYICTGLEVDEYGGTCLPDPGEGFCYNNADCSEGYVCSGGFYCPCGFDCGSADEGFGPMTEAGTCVQLLPGCCSDDSECPVGTGCVGETEGAPGVCKAVPAPGTCWEDSHCGPDSHCEAAGICPCDAMCDSEDILGACVPNLAECCFVDSMCDAGQVCIGAEPGGWAGLCVDAPLQGQCWSDADCGLSESCTEVEFCGCGANCPSFPGSCVALTPGCCLSDAACDFGETCVDEALGMGTCLPTPEGGACWDDDMCPGGLCEGASYCPCGQACPMIWPFAPGQCVYPVETCATGHIDADGVGTPCPNGPSDCLGLSASMCSSNILNDPTLPPVCTRYCNSVEPCQEGSFCIDKGWSSSCIPDSCADSFLASCNSDIECVVATKWDQCCPCPQAMTRSKLATDPCLAEGDSVPPGGIDCYIDCPAVLCAECGSALAVHCTDHQCVAIWQ